MGALARTTIQKVRKYLHGERSRHPQVVIPQKLVDLSAALSHLAVLAQIVSDHTMTGRGILFRYVFVMTQWTAQLTGACILSDLTFLQLEDISPQDQTGAGQELDELTNDLTGWASGLAETICVMPLAAGLAAERAAQASLHLMASACEAIDCPALLAIQDALADVNIQRATIVTRDAVACDGATHQGSTGAVPDQWLPRPLAPDTFWMWPQAVTSMRGQFGLSCAELRRKRSGMDKGRDHRSISYRNVVHSMCLTLEELHKDCSHPFGPIWMHMHAYAHTYTYIINHNHTYIYIYIKIIYTYTYIILH